MWLSENRRKLKNFAVSMCEMFKPIKLKVGVVN